MKSIYSLIVLITMAITSSIPALGQTIDVKDMGAVADGKTVNTTIIQQAIDQAHKAGGGTVLIPAGEFITGSLVLKSNVDLHLAKGATLKGSPDLGDYPARPIVYPSYTDNYVDKALIYAAEAENISITGQGTIDGNGTAPAFIAVDNNHTSKTRPYIIRFVKCRNVLVDGVYLRDSPMWVQHYLACEKVRLTNLRVFSHINVNNDGLDLDGCRDVVINNCIFDSGDDAITLKSTGPALCEDVVITNCIASSLCNPIKFGTETTGGFRNITISNIAIRPSEADTIIYGSLVGHAGIALEVVDGAIMEHINISNITMRNIYTPLFIRLGNRARPHTEGAGTPSVGTLRNISISNITAYTESLLPSSITGIPGHNVENIKLSNIRITAKGGGTHKQAEREVPENEAKYPEANMFGPTLPASLLYVRHVDNISMHNCGFTILEEDARPQMWFEDVDGLHINFIHIKRPEGGQSENHFDKVRNISQSQLIGTE